MRDIPQELRTPISTRKPSGWSPFRAEESRLSWVWVRLGFLFLTARTLCHIFCELVHFFFLIFFFNVLFLGQRETEHERGSGRERGRHRIGNRLQALSHQPRARRGARTHGLRDRDLAEVGRLTDCATQAPPHHLFKEQILISPSFSSFFFFTSFISYLLNLPQLIHMKKKIDVKALQFLLKFLNEMAQPPQFH